MSPGSNSTGSRLIVAPAAAVITVEEHWRRGGLGAAVAETLSEHAPRRLARIGVPDTFVTRVGSQEDLLAHCGITDERITTTALDLLGKARRQQRGRLVNGGDRNDPDLSRV